MMSGIICCACGNISHFSSTVCSAAMVKKASTRIRRRTSHSKTKFMMNLSARMPSVVSSSTSLSPVKRCYGKQDPGKSVVVDDRSGQPDKFSSTGYTKSDYVRAWSSQSGKVRLRDAIDQGKWYNKFVLITEKLFSTEMRNP